MNRLVLKKKLTAARIRSHGLHLNMIRCRLLTALRAVQRQARALHPSDRLEFHRRLAGIMKKTADALEPRSR